MTNKYIKGCSTFSAIWEMQAKPHWFILDPHYSVDTGGQGLTDIDKDQKTKELPLYEKMSVSIKVIHICLQPEIFSIWLCILRMLMISLIIMAPNSK